jgi:hypothetical protein
MSISPEKQRSAWYHIQLDPKKGRKDGINGRGSQLGKELPFDACAGLLILPSLIIDILPYPQTPYT